MYIYSIKAVQSSSGDFRFTVRFDTGHDVELEAADLNTYDRFRVKVLAETGRGCHYLPPNIPAEWRSRFTPWVPSRTEWANSVNTWLAAGREADDEAGLYVISEKEHLAA